MVFFFNDLKEREEEESCDSETVKEIMPPKDVVAFNEMRSCADIYRMYRKGMLDIQPDFQRGIVWKTKEMSLFIDSLTKQLPIPSLCMSFDFSTGKRMVIDGLQRIWTIISFLGYGQKDWRLSKIDGVDSRIAGKFVSEIEKAYPTIFHMLEDVTLPINVIRCDYSRPDHMEYLFQIFSRLNSGGRKLRAWRPPIRPLRRSRRTPGATSAARRTSCSGRPRSPRSACCSTRFSSPSRRTAARSPSSAPSG